MFLPGHVLRACLSTEEGPIEVQALSQSPRRKTYLVSDCIALKKVKEEAVLDSGRADFQRAIQEHTHSNTDFLTSFLSMLGFNLSGT